jgi:hypothetical protein
MPFQSCFTKDSGSWENSIKPNRPFFLVSKCFSLLAPQLLAELTLMTTKGTKSAKSRIIDSESFVAFESFVVATPKVLTRGQSSQPGQSTTPQQADGVSEHSDENLSQRRHPRMF